jgi:hypothetical protein
MTLETFSTLTKQAKLHQEKTSDHILSFRDIKYRMEFDKKAEALIFACMMCIHRRVHGPKRIWN